MKTNIDHADLSLINRVAMLRRIIVEAIPVGAQIGDILIALAEATKEFALLLYGDNEEE